MGIWKGLYNIGGGGGGGSGTGWDGSVTAYVNLPAAASNSGKIYMVLTTTGIPLISRKEKGLYRSDGSSWTRLGDWAAVFQDDIFEMWDNADNTKKIQWQLSGITTGNTRIITMADSDISLSDILLISGKKQYLGIEKAGTPTFDNTTHVLTIPTTGGEIIYWYHGIKYRTTSAITLDLDGTYTITAGTQYFFYFDGSAGVLKVSTSAWDLLSVVPVATVFWNGSDHDLVPELHTYNRDPRWHKWAHTNIGARYTSGLSQTYPSAAVDNQIQIESGEIADEDLPAVISQQTNGRIWCLTNASTWTFENTTTPYKDNSGTPQYRRTTDYTWQNVAASDYIPIWVYASPSTSRSIYILPHHGTSAFNTIALARAATPPALNIGGMTNELKIIYRWIYKGDGQYQETVDYRLSSPLPSGGASSTTASAVSFTPNGNISSTNVQSALEEVDLEKLATVSVDSTLSGNGTSGSPLTIPSQIIRPPHNRLGIHFLDFLVNNALPPWAGTAVSSGTLPAQTGTANHPGIVAIRSSTSSNSGYYVRFNTDSILLAGGEFCRLIFTLENPTDTTVYYGFHDSITNAAPVDGVYMSLVGTTLKGVVATNSSRTDTGTTYTCATSTWYRLDISVNSDASASTFTLYNDAGTQLWTSTVTASHPTAAGREVSHCVIGTNAGTTAVSMVYLDYMMVDITRTLTR